MKTAVLIDLAFALKRYRTLIEKPSGRVHKPEEIVECLWKTAKQHVDVGKGTLYRILCYDCAPFDRGATNPINKKFVDFRKTEVAIRNSKIHELLISRRSVAIRRGILTPRQWVLTEDVLKELLAGTKTVATLTQDDVMFEFRQKQVDMKLGLDIASLAYKQLVSRIVLLAGDSDFVPAAKLARREGIDFVLDPLWHPINPDLVEHIDGLKTFWPKPKPKPPTAAPAIVSMPNAV